MIYDMRQLPNCTTRLLFLATITLLATITILCSPSVLAASPSPTSDGLRVIVYSGPSDCSNDDDIATTNNDAGKLNKIIPNSIVGLHFTVTIDPTSFGSPSLLGKIIESSKSGMGVAPSFPVGQGKVVHGLDMGLLGLCRGSSAYIIVPPQLGYGSYGKPDVGVEPGTTLRYDVEIFDIQPPMPNDFIKIDVNRDWLISVHEAKTYFDTLGQAIDLDGLWNEEDKDKDGYISWMEFTGPKGTEGPPPDATFQQDRRHGEAAADAMKTKRREKMRASQHTQSAGRGLDDIATLLQSIDTDKDGMISKLELTETFRSLGQEMTEEFWIESDPDGDGYVSYEEFVGGSRSSTASTSPPDKMARRGVEL
jgi:Ca2+-binding EF-hand superfamily protein